MEIYFSWIYDTQMKDGNKVERSLEAWNCLRCFLRKLFSVEFVFLEDWNWLISCLLSSEKLQFWIFWEKYSNNNFSFVLKITNGISRNLKLFSWKKNENFYQIQIFHSLKLIYDVLLFNKSYFVEIEFIDIYLRQEVGCWKPFILEGKVKKLLNCIIELSSSLRKISLLSAISPSQAE